MPIAELGHVGLYVDDLDMMVDFYTRVLGLVQTDRGAAKPIAFLSSRPHHEHHEVVLIARAEPAGPRPQVNQVSWRVETLDELVEFWPRISASQAVVQHVVTHGNAVGIYFFDPEGNRLEVYWRTGIDTPQPFMAEISLDAPPAQILEVVRELVAQRPPDSFDPPRETTT